MKTFEFSRDGLNQCLQHKDYVGIAKEYAENNPQILPFALLGVLGLSVILINPGASAVAFKAASDSSMVAFKYLGGF